MGKLLLALLVPALLAAAGAALWWSRGGDAWLAEIGDRGKARVEEGMRVGRNSTPEDCVGLATARAQECSALDVLCEVAARAFLRGCPAGAPALDQFCGTLPAPQEHLARLGWSAVSCEQLGWADERCMRVVGDAVEVCDERRAPAAPRGSELRAPSG